MSKRILSASEIQKLLQSRVNLIREIVDDKDDVKIPLPYWHEEDESGCNWGIYSFSGDRGYADQVVAVIEAMKHEVQLKIS